MATLTRRAFLATALAAPAARAAAGQNRIDDAAAVSRDEFMRLSGRLVGRPDLDVGPGALYLDALLSVPGNRPLLARLARGGADSLDAAHSALERTIIEYWYTGIYTIRGERRVATHAGALMWAALGVRAPAACAGPFGAWARPPQVR